MTRGLSFSKYFHASTLMPPPGQKTGLALPSMPTSRVSEHSDTPLAGGTGAGERMGAGVGVGVGSGVGVETGCVVTGAMETPGPDGVGVGVLAHAASAATAPTHEATMAPLTTFLSPPSCPCFPVSRR